jgi:hypothetical protein
MAKTLFIFISFIFFFSYCSNKRTDSKILAKYTTFEIGFLNSQHKGLSFWTDSNKIYFSPQADKVKYGLLEDSIIQLINKVVLEITSDTSIKSKENPCDRCSLLSLKTVVGVDTISIFQKGDIDQVFLPLIRTLEKFIDNANHSTFIGTIFLKTTPPPPPRPFDSSIILKVPK